MILKLIEYITRSHKGISSSTKRTNALKIFEKKSKPKLYYENLHETKTINLTIE